MSAEHSLISVPFFSCEVLLYIVDIFYKNNTQLNTAHFEKKKLKAIFSATRVNGEEE